MRQFEGDPTQMVGNGSSRTTESVRRRSFRTAQGSPLLPWCPAEAAPVPSCGSKLSEAVTWWLRWLSCWKEKCGVEKFEFHERKVSEGQNLYFYTVDFSMSYLEKGKGLPLSSIST